MNEQTLQGYCQSCCSTPNPPWQCAYSEYSCLDCTAVPLTDHLPFLLAAGLVLGFKALRC
jgi:hypothetical protein